jgi:hypothetical protein
MTITNISLILSLLAVILTAITSIFSFLAYARVVGLENSTHKIQWVPVDNTGKTGEDLIKDYNKTFDVNGGDDHV